VDEVVGVVMERTKARRNRLTAAVIASGLFVGPQALGVAGATPDDTDGTATAYRSDIKEGASNSEIWDLADGRGHSLLVPNTSVRLCDPGCLPPGACGHLRPSSTLLTVVSWVR
jgi:hypothetical protein